MKKPEREELKRLAEEATPGPWRTATWTTGIRGTEVMDKHHVRISCDMLEHNAEFSAAANPAAMQSLLAEFDLLEAQRDRLLSALKDVRSDLADDDDTSQEYLNWIDEVITEAESHLIAAEAAGGGK